MFDIPLEKIRYAVVMLISLILSVAVHEFGHAFSADRLGDGTPRHEGRVTLNPFAHADPIGTIIVPLLAIFVGGGLFGWGRPVNINPTAFTRKLRMKHSHLIVAIAGPAMNILLAGLVTIVLAILLAFNVLTVGNPIVIGIYHVIELNWLLFFFNLLPCHPLDGGAVLAGLLPRKYDNVNQFLRQYGFLILIGLLATGVLGLIIGPPTRIMAGVFYSIAVIIGA
jgi:Zn-dependent protease